MSLQLILLALIAAFFVYRLYGVLGTRDGYEPAKKPVPAPTRSKPDVQDEDEYDEIEDYAEKNSHAFYALKSIQNHDPSFSPKEFLSGARAAYEMILSAYNGGDISDIRGFVSDEISEAFDGIIADREAKGLTVDSTILGIRDLAISDAVFDPKTGECEVIVNFHAEMRALVRDSAGEIVEGDEKKVQHQHDTWAFARNVKSDDPNWVLVDTGA